MSVARWIGVVVDCADPVRLAEFWSSLLGGTIDERTHTADWLSLRDVPGVGYLSFQRVPEGKAAKNRLHVDLAVADLREAVRGAEALGASAVGSPVDEPTNTFQVMHDPERNEFCFVAWHDGRGWG